jgi:toxin ParE1/3/4
MARFELSEAADRDLTDIYIYSYRHFGEHQADAYLIALEHCFAQLADAPGLGRAIDYVRAGYYRFRHASHVVFYVPTGFGVRIVRVLHERMDWDRHL